MDYGVRRFEVQTITIATTTALATGASSPQFTITLPVAGAGTTTGDVTPCLSWDSDAATVASALNLLPAIDGVSVSRSAAALGFVFTITFTGPYAVNGDVTQVSTATGTCPGRTFPAYATATPATLTQGAPGPVPEASDCRCVCCCIRRLAVGFVGDGSGFPALCTGSRSFDTSPPPRSSLLVLA